MDPIRQPLRRDDPRYWAWAIALMVAAGILMFGVRLVLGLAPAGASPAVAAVSAIGGGISVVAGAGLMSLGWPRGGAWRDARKPLYAFGGIVLVAIGAWLVALAVQLA